MKQPNRRIEKEDYLGESLIVNDFFEPPTRYSWPKDLKDLNRFIRMSEEQETAYTASKPLIENYEESLTLEQIRDKMGNFDFWMHYPYNLIIKKLYPNCLFCMYYSTVDIPSLKPMFFDNEDINPFDFNIYPISEQEYKETEQKLIVEWKPPKNSLAYDNNNKFSDFGEDLQRQIIIRHITFHKFQKLNKYHPNFRAIPELKWLEIKEKIRMEQKIYKDTIRQNSIENNELNRYILENADFEIAIVIFKHLKANPSLYNNNKYIYMLKAYLNNAIPVPKGELLKSYERALEKRYSYVIPKTAFNYWKKDIIEETLGRIR